MGLADITRVGVLQAIGERNRPVDVGVGDQSR